MVEPRVSVKLDVLRFQSKRFASLEFFFYCEGVFSAASHRAGANTHGHTNHNTSLISQILPACLLLRALGCRPKKKQKDEEEEEEEEVVFFLFCSYSSDLSRSSSSELSRSWASICLACFCRVHIISIHFSRLTRPRSH